jgi:hypothetical protein
LSKTRLGRLRDVMASYVERSEVPGLVALISRRSETRVEALGTKDTAFCIPASKLDRLATA